MIDDSRSVPDRLQRSGETPVQLSDILALAGWARSDLEASEARLMAEITEIRSTLRDFTTVHAQEHILEGQDRKVWQDKLTTLLDTAKIAQARKDGILGAVKFTVDLVGKNWRGVVALAGSAAIILGNVHVNIS